MSDEFLDVMQQGEALDENGEPEENEDEDEVPDAGTNPVGGGASRNKKGGSLTSSLVFTATEHCCVCHFGLNK